MELLIKKRLTVYPIHKFPDSLNNLKNCNEIYANIMKIVAFLALVIALERTFNRGFLKLRPTWKQRLDVFFIKGILKNFAKFTGKDMCWSPFLIKLYALTLLKENFSTDVFL